MDQEVKEINKSGLHPRGRAVLLIAYEPERKNSLIVVPPSLEEKTMMLVNQAMVLEIGAAAWDDEPEPRAVVGDIVLIAGYSGRMATGADGKLYRIVNDRDIFCTVDQVETKEVRKSA
jgi:co-chaperonin GroES (HSP10)